ncbi:hypothetical protein A3J44_02100 [candidate division WOR-1 bacterium RIFCSPHIGHO2_02_FULL_45_12]|uniref:Lipid-A-disaccharide synthase n=1 Tax=candidate division WOR-1 bacterium RIFCSPLOWO2_12_FULL_45_9 TaxID=1802568 RepID=A0A1F4RKW7_UNCSA|nr:MAG: hypothetical protein A3J44_02100 [candidate division WOR-1 bacterium RIFCSPHIGHO2_02_FULL_45_12]OGC08746.1 MAG: hypothetical protein A3F86_05210 [candidate division WOR-1 bacterium RIFCSPLOWO2_12_FULL_45_9]
MKKLLFITNGHGEALVADRLTEHLPADFNITRLSLANESLPSGGFSLRNLRYLAKDISAGLVGNTLKHYKILKELSGKIDLTIAIGDIIPVIGALVVKSPFVFVGVNKSSYYKSFGSSYLFWEKILLQKYALKVFVRDKITELGLKTRGIRVPKAEFVGNPLMDCMGEISNDKFPISNEGKTIIGFLPGTRDDARLNIEDFEKVAEEIEKKAEPTDKFKFIIATKLKNVLSTMENVPFEELLATSTLIVGLSGTGNEQAAGIGKPLVSFYGRGSQYNKKFADAQKELLGFALLLVQENNPVLVAARTLKLLRDPARMQEMGKIGKERMGGIGAVNKIAEFIKETI